MGEMCEIRMREGRVRHVVSVGTENVVVVSNSAGEKGTGRWGRDCDPRI